MTLYKGSYQRKPKNFEPTAKGKTSQVLWEFRLSKPWPEHRFPPDPDPGDRGPLRLARPEPTLKLGVSTAQSVVDSNPNDDNAW